MSNSRSCLDRSQKILFILAVINLLTQGCSSTRGMIFKEDKYGCPQPSIELLEKMGISRDFIEFKIKDIIEGKIDISRDPKLSDDLKKVLLEETLFSYTECLLLKRGSTPEQLCWLKSYRYFIKTNPSPAQFMLFQKIFPYPSSSSDAQEICTEQLLWLVQLGEFMKTNPSTEQFIGYIAAHPSFPCPNKPIQSEQKASDLRTFRVTLVIPRDMIGADISIDGEPAQIERMQSNILVVRVPKKPTNIEFLARKGEQSCSKKQSISTNDIILTLCESK